MRDRVAVVTGGASGIGRALAAALTDEGAKVVIADIDGAALEEAAVELRRRSSEVLAVRTDVSDRTHVQALADAAFEHFGAVHVLCNNAGVALWGGLEAATLRDWEWVLGVNLWGVIHGLATFLPRMIERGEPGHVVNTASMAGLVASAGLGVYNASKYAVVGLSETLVKDLKPYNIGVSVVCPMGVATQIRRSDRNRPAHLRDAAPAAAERVDLMGKTPAPEAVAALTIAAVKTNRLYVITHDEGLEPLRRRFRRLEGAILDRPV